MPHLPRISGGELVKILERRGYEQVRTKGSHVRLFPTDANKKKVTVPLHKELKTGTLSAIMRDAGLAPDDLRA